MGGIVWYSVPSLREAGLASHVNIEPRLRLIYRMDGLHILVSQRVSLQCILPVVRPRRNGRKQSKVQMMVPFPTNGNGAQDGSERRDQAVVYKRTFDITSFPQRHSLQLLAECSPIVGLQLSVLDPFLTPVHMQLADVILRLLEVNNLVANALLDENTSCVLCDDRLLVL